MSRFEGLEAALACFLAQLIAAKPAQRLQPSPQGVILLIGALE